jgi:hypothetical protein
MFDINGERSSFKFRPRIEACNMIGVKEEPNKEEGLKKKKEPKNECKENQGRCCIHQDKGRKAACEDQKMTKPEDKPAPKMVRKWVPKIATPAKSVDPK